MNINRSFNEIYARIDWFNTRVENVENQPLETEIRNSILHFNFQINLLRTMLSESGLPRDAQEYPHTNTRINNLVERVQALHLRALRASPPPEPVVENEAEDEEEENNAPVVEEAQPEIAPAPAIEVIPLAPQVEVVRNLSWQEELVRNTIVSDFSKIQESISTIYKRVEERAQGVLPEGTSAEDILRESEGDLDKLIHNKAELESLLKKIEDIRLTREHDWNFDQIFNQINSSIDFIMNIQSFQSKQYNKIKRILDSLEGTQVSEVEKKEVKEFIARLNLLKAYNSEVLPFVALYNRANSFI